MCVKTLQQTKNFIPKKNKVFSSEICLKTEKLFKKESSFKAFS